MQIFINSGGTKKCSDFSFEGEKVFITEENNRYQIYPQNALKVNDLNSSDDQKEAIIESKNKKILL